MNESKEGFDRLTPGREKAAQDVLNELFQAEVNHPSMRSAHEGFSILMEEVDELWDHVKVKQTKRDIAAMRAEAVQIAAMAIRFIKDICESDGSGYGQ